ncbi:asparagine synthase-related protein [Endothiovibrio diazotrophicus]
MWHATSAFLVHAGDEGGEGFLRGAGGLALLFDGHLYNRDELVPLFDLPDRCGDARLALAVLERWGEEGIGRLIGDFALAAWDESGRRLWLLASAQGRRPLLFHQGGKRVAFATDATTLMALPGVPCRVDLQTIAAYLMDRYPTDGESFFEGIESLPAATWARFSPAGLRRERYWRPGGDRPTLRLARDEEYVEAARELLDRIVAAHLRNAGPVAAFATGGLDSSTVAATTARLIAPDPLHVLTAIPRPEVPRSPPHLPWYDDETPFVQALADMHPNMHLHLTPGGGPHPLEVDPTPLFERSAMPLLKVINIFWFDALYRRIRELGIHVVMTGTSGNHTLSWFGNQAVIGQLRRGRWWRAARELALVGESEGIGWRGALRQEILSPLRRKRREWQVLSTVSGIAPGFAREVGGVKARPIPAGWRVTGREMRRAMIEGQAGGREMTNALRQWWGVEPRDPLGDPRMVDFCLSLPDEQFLKDGVRRRLARRVAADRSPPEVFENRLRGNQCPEWFSRVQGRRDEFAAVLEQMRSSPLASHCLDLPMMQRIIDDWPADAAAAKRAAFPLRGALLRGIHLGQFLMWAERLGS